MYRRTGTVAIGGLATLFTLLCLPGPVQAKAKATAAVFGETSLRSTSLYRENYDYLGGWLEGRIHIEDLPLLEKLALVPTLRLAGAASNRPEVAHENTLVYGARLETRIASRWHSLSQSPLTSWIPRTRIYGEYLELRFTGSAPDDWRTTWDWRVGAEVWQELNVERDSRAWSVWGELWGDVSYRRTGFYFDDFESVDAAAALHLGLHTGPAILMPYVRLEVRTNQWYPIHWENRALGGVGVRAMLFGDTKASWFPRVRFFAEYIRIARYLRKKPCCTPWGDFIVGVNISRGWMGF